MKKNLLINASRVGRNTTGVASFTQCFIEQCIKSFKHIDLFLSAGQENIYSVPALIAPKWFSISKVSSRLRPIFWLIYATPILLKGKRNVLSTTHHVVPYLKHQVITIHDMRLYFLPDTYLQKFYFHNFLPFFILSLDGILTVSETSKIMISKIYNYPLDKIYVVPNSLDVSRFYPRRSDNLSTHTFPYFLIVGASWHHKNAHEFLEHSDLWSDQYRLKIIASPGPYKDSLRHLVNRKRIDHKVDFLSRLEEEGLLVLYQQASALIYPSIMEGFGIPPLEAMACGVPTIVSNIDVFREVYGNSSIYVELGSRKSWVQALDTLKDSKLVAEKIKLGFLKVQEYSKERMQREVVRAIRSIWPEIELKSQNTNPTSYLYDQ
ncbi:glycosyltransferase family 4 protein [Anthocerotibacter panamensis]|uniref:glycosyltransferase family 4 protein n=1 Tax=Anthocerotibacter panamensis TaxID=2857077 RepID=UPI001C402690|nr:glycosyltransferase family 1 protein [Anthocerotibacter panamensis]